MRRSFVCLLLICYSAGIFSQSSTHPLKKSTLAVDNERWNLDKYVWSHTHHDPLKRGKPIIDFNIMDNWLSVGKQITISPNGKYIAYGIFQGYYALYSPDWPPAKIVVQALDGSWNESFVPTNSKSLGFFSTDSKKFIYEDQDSLCFLDLERKERRYVNNLASYKVPFTIENSFNNSDRWLAMLIKDKGLVLEDVSSGTQVPFGKVSSYKFDESQQWLICETDAAEKELVFYQLATGSLRSFPAPQSYKFLANKGVLLLDGGTALHYANVQDGKTATIWSSQNGATLSDYNCLSNEESVVLNVKEGANDTNTTSHSIWYWKFGMSACQLLLANGAASIPTGLQIAGNFENTRVSDRYISFWLVQPDNPTGQASTGQTQASEDIVPLTIWSSKDRLLQTTQAEMASTRRKHMACLDIANGTLRYVQKDNEQINILGDVLIVIRGNLYLRTYTDRFWDTDTVAVWAYGLENGFQVQLPSKRYKTLVRPWLSPGGRYLVSFSNENGHYYSLDVQTGKLNDICKGIPHKYLKYWDRDYSGYVTREEPQGQLGWLQNDCGFLVYDQYDIWQLDPSGAKAPLNLTNGYGRLHQTVFRALGDRDHANTVSVDSRGYVKDNVLRLIAFNLRTKENGFFQKRLESRGNPELLSMGTSFIKAPETGWLVVLNDRGLEPLKAEQADIWIVKRHTQESGANYCATKDFKTYTPLTFLRQHQQVNWYTRELHHFSCLDGSEGEGILYKPENFDPQKKYPVIMPFYMEYASYLHVYQDPVYQWAPTASCTSPAWFTSHGYLVFVPSVRIAKGRLGAEAFNVIEGAAKYLKKLPFANGRIGVASHSWSAKLGSYIFTHSKTITTSVISEGLVHGNVLGLVLKPTSDGRLNEVSGLEGIEKGFEYGDLWKNKNNWLEQTTILNLDKVRMPVMLICGNEGWKGDYSQYSQQTFEIFTGLRRLNKPVWWFMYDHGGHILEDANELKDYTIRLTQYFDHLLKGAPAPRWMTQGLPNKLRLTEARKELDEVGWCSDNCEICKKRHSK